MSKYPYLGARKEDSSHRYIVKFTSKNEGEIIWSNSHVGETLISNDSWEEKLFFRIPEFEEDVTGYPCVKVLRDEGVLVKFTNKKTGTVMFSANSRFGVGETSTSWAESYFIKLPKVRKEKEEKKMQNLMDNLFESNKCSAIEAAKRQAGRTALKAVRDATKKALPKNISSQLDNPVGLLVLANIINQVLPNVTENEFAAEMSEQALVAAYENALEALHIEELIQNFIGIVSASVKE